MEWRPVNIAHLSDKLLILKIVKNLLILNINSLSKICTIFTGLHSIKIKGYLILKIFEDNFLYSYILYFNTSLIFLF